MKASISWLQDYVEIATAVPRLADALTMVGLEVEALGERYDYLDRVQVGRIKSVAPHPAADALSICQVESGEGIIQVVCGAPNAAPGLLAPLALPGTALPNGTRLSRSQIRGQASEGMLCSETELGLGCGSEGLMALDPRFVVGTPLAKALELSDAVLEIGLTPNRADCLCMLGIAREIAAIQKTPLRYPDSRAELEQALSSAAPDEEIASLAAVRIEAPTLCPRYAARMIVGATVRPSPYWIQSRLLSVGLRPINNLVDVTNFVMMECGQPLHAFDYDLLAGGRIEVRTARQEERFVTLDGKERQLTPEMLLICDAEKAVAIAGVMGGLNSEITPATRRVLIEGALFQPGSVRRTARAFGLATDAPHRFERGVDPRGTLRSLERAAGLMIRTSDARGVAGVIDVHPGKQPLPRISLPVAKANALLGTHLAGQEMTDLLTAIEFVVEEETPGTLTVTPPACRVDVSRPEDLVEEVARRWGYERIPTAIPQMPDAMPLPSRRLATRGRVRQLMNGFGFHEAIHYSFIAADGGARLRLRADDRRRQGLAILNPLSEEGAVMRTSLLPGLLQAMERNLSQGVRTLKIYETGRVYLSNGSERQPEEIEMLAGLWTGNRVEGGWAGPAEACDFYDLKGVLEGLFAGLELPPASFSRVGTRQYPYLMEGHAARIGWGGQWVGEIGEVDPLVMRQFNLKTSATIFEIEMAGLERQIPQRGAAVGLPRFPAVARDLTLIVDRELEAGELVSGLTAVGESLLESVQLFAVYEGDPVAAGSKSVSLRMTYRSASQTLSDEQVNQVHHGIAQLMLERFKGSLPG